MKKSTMCRGLEWVAVLTQFERVTHIPSIAFRHLPPNSARIGYATEETLFMALLSGERFHFANVQAVPAAAAIDVNMQLPKHVLKNSIEILY